jgi:hypothetical protein
MKAARKVPEGTAAGTEKVELDNPWVSSDFFCLNDDRMTDDKLDKYIGCPWHSEVDIENSYAMEHRTVFHKRSYTADCRHVRQPLCVSIIMRRKSYVRM